MTKNEAAVIMAYTGIATLSGEDFDIFHKYIEHILGRPVYTHELGIKIVSDEIREKSKNDFIDICKNTVDTSGSDPLVWAFEEARLLNMKLSIRCGNDNIRVSDVEQSLRICKLIETAMGVEKE